MRIDKIKEVLAMAAVVLIAIGMMIIVIKGWNYIPIEE